MGATSSRDIYCCSRGKMEWMWPARYRDLLIFVLFCCNTLPFSLFCSVLLSALLFLSLISGCFSIKKSAIQELCDWHSNATPGPEHELTSLDFASIGIFLKWQSALRLIFSNRGKNHDWPRPLNNSEEAVRQNLVLRAYQHCQSTASFPQLSRSNNPGPHDNLSGSRLYPSATGSRGSQYTWQPWPRNTPWVY